MTDSLAAALAELQANPPRIRKKARAQYGAYADLPSVTAALRPVLAKLGLVWMTWPAVDEDGFTLRFRLIHMPSGESLTGSYPIHATDPQKAGSEITYARRYALVTVTGVTPEGDDDDGQAASRARTPAKIPGPDHERLRHGTVVASPDDRPTERVRAGDNPVDNSYDPWADQEPGRLPVQQLPEERPGTIDGKQRSKIMAKIGRMSHRDRAELLRRTITREEDEPQIESTNDLSWTEADRIGKAIDRKEWP